MDNYGNTPDKYLTNANSESGQAESGQGSIEDCLFFEYEQGGRLIRAYQDDVGYKYTFHREGREVYRLMGKTLNLHEALQTDDPERARRIIYSCIGSDMEGLLTSGFSEADDPDDLVDDILEILQNPDKSHIKEPVDEDKIISYPYHGGLVFMDYGERMIIGVSSEGHLEDALREYDVIVDGCIDIDESYMLQDPSGAFHYTLRVLSQHARPVWVLSERGRVYEKFKEKGLIVSEGLRSANALRTLLNHMKRRRILTVRYGYDKPGLYWDGKVIKVHIDTTYDYGGLREALLTLEEYISDLPESQRVKHTIYSSTTSQVPSIISGGSGVNPPTSHYSTGPRGLVKPASQCSSDASGCSVMVTVRSVDSMRGQATIGRVNMLIQSQDSQGRSGNGHSQPS